ncbi:molybdopterin biosynthesis protein [uncultured Methanomethylovorans sp.]|uniref:molybdopterin biosynthesis protein n=1 Tax=uncultured Methanomethylovorans sp. TaxID=183759 RepID=UPI002AA8CB56|nr:molybdopterin biosynthesis protein [uncultured Methanomethylovorans sp.]
MEQKEFRELKSSKEAHLILQNIKINPNLELLPLEKAIGCVLAEDICSEIDVPAFDRAVKDGFAVRAQDTYTATEIEPVKLNKTVSIAAGYISNLAVGSQEAIEIATGAQIPDGSDAIVMVEHTTIEEGDLLIKRAVHVNENIMRTGADIMKGERVLRRNMRLGSREIGVLASIGLSEVRVRKLKVGIISTGDELLRPGSDLEIGKIYDANSYAIAASVEECGAHPVIYGIVKDNERSMSDIIDRALRECNMVLTSGSTSAGVGDIMYKIIADKGNTLLHGISIKPGKPVVVGVIDNKPLIGLPGNPTSALSIINEFIAPMIYDSLEIAPPCRTKVKAIIGTGIKSEGREELFPVGLVRGRVYPADKTSGAITTLSEADGIIEISEETEYLEPGKQVDVTLFGNVPLVDVIFVGGQCPGIDLLEDMTGMNIRMINMGSSRGLSAMASGIADVAGINLIGSDEYNLEAIKGLGISNAFLVKGYRREQGLIVRKESTIKSLDDLPGKKLINRNRGSGTRALLDRLLEEMVEKRSISKTELVKTIPGYNSGSRTHRSVCEAVKCGKAEVGFGIRPFAEARGLKFIPLAIEDFDLLINKKIMGIPQIKNILSVLTSKEFSMRLPSGTFTYNRTGEVIENI